MNKIAEKFHAAAAQVRAKMNIEELKTAAQELQRTVPESEECKAAQSAWQKALNDEEWQQKLAARTAQRAIENEQRAALKARILSPRAVPQGARLVAMTLEHAQWAGMAPSVAGGWVATALPRVGFRLVALVPEGRFSGLPLDLAEVQRLWADECVDLDEMADAAEKIEALPAA